MMTQRFKIKKGDTVMVITGKDRGKTGKVLQMGENGKVFVEKINLLKKHVRPSKASKGGIVEKEGGLYLSKVMIMCPQCEEPSRVGIRTIDTGKRLRYCKKCEEVIDKG
ncbi:MAG: 50S ribosomal protein L24 [Nitrospira sp.]|nr:50S ribosomal protein L24 [Nitrospira sp.]